MQRQQKNEAIDALYEISDVLHCGIDRRAIEILYTLADKGGLNAEALASILIGLREECSRVQAIEVHEESRRRNKMSNGV